MAEQVTFASNGGTCGGLFAVPESGRGPGVVVIQEWWGLVPHVEHLVDRFAEAGFVALAPDLYHGAKTDEPDEAMRMMMSLAMDPAARDIAGAARFLFESDPTDGVGIGSVGFCMGGSLALWSATLAPQLTTAVGFYPALPWERMSPEWPNYEGKAAMIHCSEADGTSSASGIQLAKTAVEEAGGSIEIFDYPGTQHAFFNDARPEVYDAAASETAWQRTVEFLRARLSG
ncbi:MAG: dienelactone hydrolase family protein [Actinomycetes bacterium]